MILSRAQNFLVSACRLLLLLDINVCRIEEAIGELVNGEKSDALLTEEGGW